MPDIKTRAARRKFLEQLALTGNVTQSAKAARFSTQYAYAAKARDPDFALLWQEAEDLAVEGLLAEARRRAVEGVETPVVYGGKLVHREDGSEVTIRHYSDRLLEMLLKARMSSRDVARQAGAGAEEPKGLSDEERLRRVEQLLEAGRQRAGRVEGRKRAAKGKLT